MGCKSSKDEGSTYSSRVFKVVNVDIRDNDVYPGKIEITNDQLIFHKRNNGSESICWPLTSIRRYGYEGDMFSFESGRRCPTGPGVFAFRCGHAEALFNLLQDCISRVGQLDMSVSHQQLMNSEGTATGASNNRNTTAANGLIGHHSGAGERHHPVRLRHVLFTPNGFVSATNHDGSGDATLGNTTADDRREYINTDIAQNNHNLNVVTTTGVVNLYSGLESAGNDEDQWYDVPPTGVRPVSAARHEEGGAMYMNFRRLLPHNGGSRCPTGKSGGVFSGDMWNVPESFVPKISYAQLDLKCTSSSSAPMYRAVANGKRRSSGQGGSAGGAAGGGCSSASQVNGCGGSVPPQESVCVASYADIDFKRTSALASISMEVRDKHTSSTMESVGTTVQ